MAPTRETTLEQSIYVEENKEETDEKENLWVSILSEVQARSNSKLPSCKQVLVLGDNEVGKTTLIAKLQGVEDPKKGSELEYGYIDVRDEYRDDHTRLSVWVLDGDPTHAHLLRFVLTEETLPHTLVVFTVAMTTPWGIMDQLHKWTSILQDHIDKLSLSADSVQEFKQKFLKRWQDYIEPGDELEQATSKRTSRSFDEDSDVHRTHQDNMILTRNLGLDVIVAVTKTDYMSTLEKEYDYHDEHFDFIQQWLRKFCLQYGAALFYTSVKEDKNCDLLYKYLVHRIYGFPFRTPALVVEKDAVFIPSGWDNEKKISILYENMQSVKPDDYFADVIAKPITRKPATRETEIQCEMEQTFLLRQQQLLQQGLPAPGTRQDSPLRAPAGVQKSAERRASAAAAGVQVQLGSPKKIDGGKPGAAGTSEGVLANFFNSLLSKKTGAGPQPPMKTSDKAAVRSDAAAELDRLTRNKKTPAAAASTMATSNTDTNTSEC